MSCPVGTDVALAARIVCSGGLVSFPTETVYGLGANALDVHAVARVFEVKGRPKFDPLIVHVADAAQLGSLVREFPPMASDLGKRFWPGPLTLVLPKTDAVPDLVTAGLHTVAVRVPDHPLALAFLRTAAVPVAGPSANPFGRLSPTCAAHVFEQLGERIDYILDGGPCRVGIESTVLDLSSGRPTLLRPGGVTLEQLESVVGPVEVASSSERDETQPPRSPGMLSRHYAPRTPLMVQKALPVPPPSEKWGLLTLRPVEHPSGYATIAVLSESGDLVEAAANFFAALRRLDGLKLDCIVAVPFPEERLGRALNDRLRRASHGSFPPAFPAR